MKMKFSLLFKFSYLIYYCFNLFFFQFVTPILFIYIYIYIITKISFSLEVIFYMIIIIRTYIT
jgi:hypothetical protein